MYSGVRAREQECLRGSVSNSIQEVCLSFAHSSIPLSLHSSPRRPSPGQRNSDSAFAGLLPRVPRRCHQSLDVPLPSSLSCVPSVLPPSSRLHVSSCPSLSSIPVRLCHVNTHGKESVLPTKTFMTLCVIYSRRARERERSRDRERARETKKMRGKRGGERKDWNKGVSKCL